MALVDALINFEKIAPSHSTTARSYSIWNLCKKEVEPTIIAVLGEDFFNVIAKDGFSKNAKEDARQLENRIREFSRILSNLNFQDKEIKQRYGTLETLISLIHFCKSFRPHTYSVRLGNEQKGEPIRRLAYRKGLEHFPFCELCDKLCEAEENKVKRIEPEYKEHCAPSSRYCGKHKPGKSAYRRDHHRRKAFHNKIEELENALVNKTYTEGIGELKTLLEEQFYYEEDVIKNYPDSHSELDAIIRYVACRIVHPQRKTSLRGKGATLQKLRESLANGKNISEAAKEAGVTRQAGWKALKKAGDI